MKSTNKQTKSSSLADIKKVPNSENIRKFKSSSISSQGMNIVQRKDEIYFKNNENVPLLVNDESADVLEEADNLLEPRILEVKSKPMDMKTAMVYMKIYIYYFSNLD